MTRIRRIRTEQGFIYSPAAINDAMTATVEQVAQAVGQPTFDPLNPPGLKVLCGFELSNQDGLELAFSPGVIAGFAGDHFACVPQTSGIGWDIEPNDADPRWDRLYLTVEDGPRAVSSQGRVNDVPASVATQQGGAVVPGQVEGTPAGSPTLPDIPAGAVLIADVFVPPGSGDPIVLDRRELLPTVRTRPAAEPIDFVGGTSEDSTIDLLRVVGRADDADEMGGAGPSYESSIRWDRDEDYPLAVRDKGVAGQTSGAHALMLIPGGRTYQVTQPVSTQDPAYWFGRNLSAGDQGLNVDITSVDAAALFVTSVNTASDQMAFSIPVESALRGLRIHSAGVSFSTGGLSPGSTEMTVKLQHKGKLDSSWSDVASKSFFLGSSFGLMEYALDDVGPLVVTGYVRFLIHISRPSGGGSGSVGIHGLTFGVTEGRA